MFSGRSVQEIIQIIANGGGVTMDGVGRTQTELCQIAANAKRCSVRVIFRNLQIGTTEIVQIASNGGGFVSFE